MNQSNPAILKYKGYRGSIEFSVEDNLYFGKVLNIDDLISYEGKTVEELEENFIEAIEDYLDE